MNDFERVKQSIDFRRYVERHMTVNKQKKALCLFHADKDPSMHIYDDSYHCFQCQASGDLFDFAMKYHGWSRQEALMELAREANIQLTPLLPHNKEKHEKREWLYQVNERACGFYERMLFSSQGKLALRYLTDERQLSIETIKTARLGFAPSSGALFDDVSDDDMIAAGLYARKSDSRIPSQVFWSRLMIPMFDHKGRIVGFSGRALLTKQEPKYKNTSETDIFHKGQIIYSILSDKGVRNDALTIKVKVIVEGHMDVISAYNRGFKHVYAQMGSSLSPEQLNLLCRNGVERLIFCLDNDQAGQNATERLVKEHVHRAADLGVDLYVMKNPHGKDPDDTFRERPELWQPAVDAARPAIDVLIELSIGALPQNATAIDKQKIAQKLLPLLKGSNAILQETSLQSLAAALNLSLETMRSWTDHQPDLRLVPRPATLSIPVLNLPQMELTVMHGLLVNDDQRWLDRANAALMCRGDYPNALSQLSLNDFTHPQLRTLMSLIKNAPERPFDTYVFENIGTGLLSEVYHRACYKPFIEGMTGRLSEPLCYDAFLRSVFTLRRIRIEREISQQLIPGTQLVEWISARRVLS